MRDDLVRGVIATDALIGTFARLDDPSLRPDGWTIRTAPARVAAQGDAWADLARHGRSIESRRQHLGALLADVDPE